MDMPYLYVKCVPWVVYSIFHPDVCCPLAIYLAHTFFSAPVGPPNDIMNLNSRTHQNKLIITMTTMKCLLVLATVFVSVTEAFSPIHKIPNLVRSFREMQNSLLHVSSLQQDPLAVNVKESMSPPPPSSDPSFMNEIENKLSFVLDNVKSKLPSVTLASSAAAKPVTSLIDDMSAKLSSSSWTSTSFIQECTSQVSVAVDFCMKKADKMLESAWANDVLPLQELAAVSSIFCITYGLFGGVPILSQVVNFMLGPGLLALGSGTIVLGVDDCQIHLTPLSLQSFEQTLATDGIYSKIRHPIYAGILAVLVGFSVVMTCAPSLVLAAVLWYGLDRRTNFEEGQCMKEFGSEYVRYKKSVPGKFLPKQVACMFSMNNGS